MVAMLNTTANDIDHEVYPMSAAEGKSFYLVGASAEGKWQPVEYEGPSGSIEDQAEFILDHAAAMGWPKGFNVKELRKVRRGGRDTPPPLHATRHPPIRVPSLALPAILLPCTDDRRGAGGEEKEQPDAGRLGKRRFGRRGEEEEEEGEEGARADASQRPCEPG